MVAAAWTFEASDSQTPIQSSALSMIIGPAVTGFMWRKISAAYAASSTPNDSINLLNSPEFCASNTFSFFSSAERAGVVVMTPPDTVISPPSSV